MKLKKITTMLLALCTIFAFTACGNDPEEIAWEGYEDMPFIEFLEEAMPEMISESRDVDVTVSVEEGWDTSDLEDKDADYLDEEDAEEPYTYYYVETEVDDEKSGYRFYMDVTDDDLLTIEGAVLFEGDDEPDFIKGRKAEDALEEMLEEYEEEE